MLHLPERRAAHYSILIAAIALLTLPGLGRPSLWDIDEGVNAEAAREMLESGNYVVPKFNFQLRDAKPALLYWCQVAAYRLFGVNEFAARLPSALAAGLAVLLLYEFGRRLFSPTAGLIAGVVLLSSFLVCGVAHFANPDALLLACTTITFLSFWVGCALRQNGDPPRRGWFIPVGIGCGLGMLAKGPVALALPWATIILYLLWQRQLRLLWDRRILLSSLAFLLVAMPWYTMVTIETRGEFARGFFLKNNLHRFLEPMENHRGQVWYHFAVLPVGMAPWSAFFLPVFGFAARCARPGPDNPPARVSAVRFLLCWVAVYLVFFSLSATKLPNYALPLYPALALLTAHAFDAWRRGEYQVRGWLGTACFAALVAIGVGTTVGLAVAGGVWRVPGYTGPLFAELGRWAWIGVALIVFSVAGWAAAVRQRRSLAISLTGLGCVASTALVFAGPLGKMEGYKAVRSLVDDAGTRIRDRDVRLASYQFSQPSLVYYNQREVRPLHADDQVAAFLAHPLPAYLFVPEPVWQRLREQQPALRHDPVARRWDIYKRCDILVISNQPPR